MSNYASTAQMQMPSLCARCLGEIDNRRPLTKRQAEIMAYLREYYAANLYAPSFEEIAKHFGYSSLATVHEHLGTLQRKGWIFRAYNESRAITLIGDAPHEHVDIVDKLSDEQVQRIVDVLNEAAA